MEQSHARGMWTERSVRAGEEGATLVEVLAAIFIMGVGLLALLTLFPLGALDMAQAIEDERTGAVAVEAQAFGNFGEELLTRTAEFITDSLSKGSVDPVEVTRLRDEYQHLAAWAEDLEVQLEALQSALPRWQAQRYLDPLLAQIRSIKLRTRPFVQLLSLVAGGAVRP
jgi:hypothetical protein